MTRDASACEKHFPPVISGESGRRLPPRRFAPRGRTSPYSPEMTGGTYIDHMTPRQIIEVRSGDPLGDSVRHPRFFEERVLPRTAAGPAGRPLVRTTLPVRRCVMRRWRSQPQCTPARGRAAVAGTGGRFRHPEGRPSGGPSCRPVGGSPLAPVAAVSDRLGETSGRSAAIFLARME